MSQRIDVYTANFGSYDVPVDPIVYNDCVDYLYFTDTAFQSDNTAFQSDKWNIICVDPPCDTYQRSSRYYFTQSCVVAQNYDITIMHGANAQLLRDPVSLVDEYLTDNDMALFKHPYRKTVAGEFDAVVSMGKDTAGNVSAQRQRYWDSGFPDNIGLSACILIIRRNTRVVAGFERLWWNEVRNGSHKWFS